MGTTHLEQSAVEIAAPQTRVDKGLAPSGFAGGAHRLRSPLGFVASIGQKEHLA